MPYVSRLPYAPGDFFCRPAHCCAEATGKKSQTRPVLRLGRRADGVWRSVFSSAVRGTRPPIEKKYCYFLYFPSLPRCAARAFSPQEPATLARRSLRRRCSGVGLPRNSFVGVIIRLLGGVLPEEAHEPCTSFPPKCRQDCRRIPYKTLPYQSVSGAPIGALPGFARLEHLYRTMLCRVGQVYCYNSS